MASQTSCSVLRDLGPQIQWVHSYVTDNKIYCVYRAPNEEMIREHAQRGGFPANKISQVRTTIDPTTAEYAAAARGSMSHVFISYARADEPLAGLIADELREAGFEVWRDDELPAHRAYAEVIEERIKGAKAVVVLWSAEAAKSQWVRAEADTARAADKLIQASSTGRSRRCRSTRSSAPT